MTGAIRCPLLSVLTSPTMNSGQFVGDDELVIAGALGVIARDLTTARLP